MNIKFRSILLKIYQDCFIHFFIFINFQYPYHLGDPDNPINISTRIKPE